MCSSFTYDCGYDKSTITFIGEVYCPNTNCSGKLCLHKKTIQSLEKRRLSMSAMRVCVPGAQYLILRSSKFVFLSFGQGVFIIEESPKSIQIVIGDV